MKNITDGERDGQTLREIAIQVSHRRLANN